METIKDIRPSFDSLHHYTSIEALQSIIQNQELWLTNVRFMNDPTEQLLGSEIVKKGLISKVEEMAGGQLFEGFRFIDEMFSVPVYLTSFSKQVDLLSQWRSYCPGNGKYAIEFDARKLLRELSTGVKDTIFFDCNYDESKQLESFDNQVDYLFSKLLAVVRKEVEITDVYQDIYTTVFEALMHKHSSFSEEQEVRMVTIAEGKPVQFRSNGSLLLPYVKVKFDTNSISKLIIGPMAEQDLAEKGLQSFLKSMVDDSGHGLKSKPLVEKSNIPLRRI